MVIVFICIIDYLRSNGFIFAVIKVGGVNKMVRNAFEIYSRWPDTVKMGSFIRIATS
jgi:hypothetical protein